MVADDNPAILRELVSLLRMEFNVVCVAQNGQSALECVRNYRPDVVVLDLQMPFSGLDVTRELRKVGASPAVVICSTENDPEIIEEVHQSGALGYVFKPQALQDLSVAVKAAASGESFTSSL